MRDNNKIKLDFIIPAGGIGKRTGMIIPKQYVKNKNGISILNFTIEKFLSYMEKKSLEGNIIVVVSKDIDKELLIPVEDKRVKYVFKAGANREETVFNGLKESLADIVLIHDAVRPYLPFDVIDRVVDALLSGNRSVIPVISVMDTLINENGNTVDRNKIKIVQTPQGFYKSDLINWMNELYNEKLLERFTDESSISVYFGQSVFFVEGSMKNKKITYKEDLEDWMNNSKDDFRVGYGYDIHKFSTEKEKPLILGGIEIPYEKSLSAHSDGDVVVHALMDAILGASGERDIGIWFPDDSQEWEGASSIEMLQIIMKNIKPDIINADVVIRCEKPKLKDFIPLMVDKLSTVLSAPVSVKATTDEGLGPVGKGEGIAVHAVVLLRR